VVNDENGYANSKGAGASGGLGFAFLSYLNAELKSGAQLVMDTVGFREHISGADFFVTGEGRMDSQTVMGKAPSGAAAAAKANGAKVIAFAGSVVSDNGRSCDGMDAVFSIQPGPVDLATAMKPEIAAGNLADTAEQVFRLIAAAQ
jgi:glycerate kinase